MKVKMMCVFNGVRLKCERGMWKERQDCSSHSALLSYLDGFIWVSDEGNEERQHHVDEEGDEGVEVRPTEKPH